MIHANLLERLCIIAAFTIDSRSKLQSGTFQSRVLIISGICTSCNDNCDGNQILIAKMRSRIDRNYNKRAIKITTNNWNNNYSLTREMKSR